MWMAILKNLNHRKIIRKTQINNILLKTKTILKPKYKLSGGPVSTFSLPRGDDSPLHPAVSYATDFTTAQRWLEISPVKLAYHRREAVWWMLVRSRKRLPRNVANGTANGKTAKNTLHRTQWRSQPKIWGGKVWGEKCLILGEKHFFVWDAASQDTKWQDMLKIWGARPLGPLRLRIGLYTAHRTRLARSILSLYNLQKQCDKNCSLLPEQWRCTLVKS